jgi:hypothetical protein
MRLDSLRQLADYGNDTKKEVNKYDEKNELSQLAISDFGCGRWY